MQLTIIDAKSQAPLLVLSEDDRGISVVGGDPKYVQALGLNQYSSLKEIADHINSAKSDVQAIFDQQDPQEAQAQQNEPDMDSRIKPAMQMIKQLMDKVNDRKKREQVKARSEKPETKLENSSESEVMMNLNDHIYVSVDGDNIGNAVARAEEQDDEQALSEISSRINAGQSIMTDWASRHGGYVVEQGGDEGVMKVPSTAMKDIENLRQLYRQTVGATCSVGVGRKISESTKARMLAKLKGKDRTVVYEASTPQELELRLQDDEDGGEAKKLRHAMRSDGNPNNPESKQRIDQEPTTGNTPKEEPSQLEQDAQEPPAPHRSQKLSQARAIPVQQGEGEQEEKIAKEEREVHEKHKGKPVGKIDDELMKAMFENEAAAKKQKESKVQGDAHHDPEIEAMDFSEHDDPNLAKTVHYLVRHGERRR
jgi:hypothetical protein